MWYFKNRRTIQVIAAVVAVAVVVYFVFLR
jgi:hypothetical protein